MNGSCWPSSIHAGHTTAIGVVRQSISALLLHHAAAAAVRDEHEAATPTAEEADWGTGCIVEALEHIVADLARLHSLLPELNLLDK